MITIDSKEFKQLIHKPAALRGERDFDSAIQLIEGKLPELDEDCIFNVYHELFKAAEEKGDRELATQYA